jgi:hypothetical protein
MSELKFVLTDIRLGFTEDKLQEAASKLLSISKAAMPPPKRQDENRATQNMNRPRKSSREAQKIAIARVRQKSISMEYKDKQKHGIQPASNHRYRNRNPGAIVPRTRRPSQTTAKPRSTRVLDSVFNQ